MFTYLSLAQGHDNLALSENFKKFLIYFLNFTLQQVSMWWRYIRALWSLAQGHTNEIPLKIKLFW